MTDNSAVFKIEHGCVVNDAFGSPKSTSREWVAVVVADRGERSGLARAFLTKGQRGWHRLPSSLPVGTLMEFASDEIDRRGRRTEYRAYYEVLEVHADRLVTREIPETVVRSGNAQPAPVASLSEGASAALSALRALSDEERAAVLAALALPT